MAQPAQFAIKYQGAVHVHAGDVLLGSDFAEGTLAVMKTKGVISVSINGLIAFTVTYDDVSVIDITATYRFDTECIIAYGVYVELA